MSNQPNGLSYTNPNHLEYFKFGGMLIERALINGICIDAYLTRNFIVNQINAFCECFDALIPHEIIKIFTPNQLLLLICGIPDIDIVDLRNNVVYEYPYDEKTPVVEMFFQCYGTMKTW
ncbi:hypothetical protein M9Y10_030882 [Tritrichomonas musculus]|uniref:HECT-type E3 ubiquitin transferase n=1 Tax=Tritrichomonas musculus TaxID=1915356 RepID=A0ABR2H2E8_9EUKA